LGGPLADEHEESIAAVNAAKKTAVIRSILGESGKMTQ
jgi:hypothetical protein